MHVFPTCAYAVSCIVKCKLECCVLPGTNSMSVHGAKISQTLGLGLPTKDLHLSDAELGRITALGGFVFGGSQNGNVHVGGMSDASTDMLSTIMLTATKPSKLVVFDQAVSTFNKGVLTQAAGGVVLSEDVVTTSSMNMINTGTGTMTVVSTKSLSTSNQVLQITANDVDFQGSISTGTHAVVIGCSTEGRLVGLGDGAGQLSISGLELGTVSSTGMVLGGLQCGKQTVSGITAANSNAVTSIFTILASRDNIQVVFTGAASTFNAIAVKADDSILLRTELNTDTAGLYLDGNRDDYIDSNDLIGFTDGRTVSAATEITLESVYGTIVPAGTLTLNGGTGVVIHDHIQSSSFGSTLVINADYESAQDGTLTVTVSKTIQSNNGVLQITAWDIDLDGYLHTGTAATCIHGAKVDQIISLGLTVKDMHIADDEMGHITTNAGLYVGSSVTGGLLLDGVTDTNSDSFATIVLLAMRDATVVQFEATASSFNKGIVIQSTGGVVLSESVMTKATTSVIWTGTGTLTISSLKTLSTSDKVLTITADDINLDADSQLSSGTASIDIKTHTATHTIGMGATNKDMHIDDDELGCITTDGGLVIGDSSSGDISISGIKDSNSDTIATLVLHATKATKVVEFLSSPSSFNKGITIQAKGVVLEDAVTTKASPTVLHTATGTITISSTGSLSTSDQLLLITTDDLDFQGSVSTGDRAIKIECSTAGQTVGVGTTSTQFTLTGAGVGTITSAGLVIGGTQCGSQVVNGITNANSVGVGSIFTILANRDDAVVTFSGNAATFNALHVHADAGVVVKKNVTTTGGILHLDGDGENSGSGDTPNMLGFTDALTLTAATLLTLEATSADIQLAGSLSLRAGSGVVILETMANTVAGSTMVIDADFDSAGDGTLTIVSAEFVSSNHGDVTITAWDIELDGSLTAGTATLSIHGAKVAQTFGLGQASLDLPDMDSTQTSGTPKDMHLMDAELGRLTARGGFRIGSTTAGMMFIAGLTDSNTDSVGRIELSTHTAPAKAVFYSFPSSFNKGVTVQAIGGIILSQSVTTKQSETVFRAGDGTLQIVDRMSLSTSGQLLVVTADDIDLQAVIDDVDLNHTCSVSTGTASMILATENAKTIGVGNVTDEMDIDARELALITATGLTLGSLGINKGITVVGIEEYYSNKITKVVTLLTTVDDSSITFTTTASTFFALSTQADNGIVLTCDLTTSSGHMYLDSDYEDSSTADSANSLEFVDGHTLSAESILTLEASSGSLFAGGAISVNAGEGIVIHDSMYSVLASKAVVINADYESAGDGTLTLATGKLIMTNDATVVITAWDLDLDGSITSGTQAATIHGAKVDQTIALGESTMNMQISDAELSRFTMHAGLTIGSSATGSIAVDGIKDSSSDEVATIVLVATKQAKTIMFTTGASEFNKGIVLQAMGGIVFSESVTTRASTTTMSAGTGTLTVANSKSLSSTSQVLLITTDDVDIAVDTSVSSGTVGMTIVAFSASQEVAFGGSPKDLYITDSEFSSFTAVGLLFGNTQNAEILVDGISEGSSNGISEVLTMTAARDNVNIEFSGSASTFNIFAAQADNGVYVKADISTTGADMYLDADFENSSSSDGANSISFTDSRTLSAKTVLTLEASTGSIQPHGDVTLQAGCGIVLLDNLQGASSNKQVVINADYEVAGDGTLTIVAGKTLTSNDCTVTITAWDIDLDGSINSGIEATNIHGSKLLQTVGLGATAKDMHLDDTELEHIVIAGGLHIGSDNDGPINAENVTSAGGSNIQPITSLVAYHDDQQIEFTTGASTFHALAAQADNGVIVKVDVTTSTGGMYLNGDLEDSSSSDSLNTIGFTDAVTATAKTLLTLETTTTSVWVPYTTLTLRAGSGIVIYENMKTETNAALLTFETDYESAGDGTLTLTASKTITTNKGDLVITAWDIDLDGSLTSGTHPISIHGSKFQQTIGIGASAANMHISNSELQRTTTSGGMIIGSSSSGLLILNGITRTESHPITPLVTLIASGDDQQVLIHGSASTFISLAIQADNGIIMKKDITTSLASLYLDADVDVGGDTNNNIGFTDGRTLQAKTLLTLQAETGKVIREASLSMRAGTGIVILDSLETENSNCLLVLNADYEHSGDGTLTVASAATITSNNSSIVLTAWDLDLQGSITAGTAAITFHGSKVDQTIGLGDTSKDMHITDSELSRLTTIHGFTLGSSSNGSITVNRVTDTNSDTMGTISLLATKQAKLVTFKLAPSSFNKGIVVQAKGGIVLSESVTTKACSTDLITGTGSLTIVSAKSLITTGQLLTVTADDIDFHSNAAFSSGTALTNIYCYTPDTTIGLGSASRDMSLTGAELQMMTVTGLLLGDTHCGSVTVDDVQQLHTDTIGGIMTMLASRDDASIIFVGSGSTFNTLSMQADNGVSAQARVNTDVGNMIIDGDLDNSSTEDSRAGVVVKAGKTISAKEKLTLDATNNGIVAYGAATFEAGSGILINDHLDGTDGILVLHSDYESHGDGTLTVVGTKRIVSANNPILVTAWDVDVSGDITAGTMFPCFHESC